LAEGFLQGCEFPCTSGLLCRTRKPSADLEKTLGAGESLWSPLTMVAMGLFTEGQTRFSSRFHLLNTLILGKLFNFSHSKFSVLYKGLSCQGCEHEIKILYTEQSAGPDYELQLLNTL
jgi:hypothetical protein